MNCIEEIITIPILLERLDAVMAQNQWSSVIDALVRQSVVELHLNIQDSDS